MPEVNLCSIPDSGKRRKLPNGTTQKWLERVALNYSGDECLTWPFAKNAYGRAVMNIGGKVRQVCRIVCEHFNGPPPSRRHEAAHSCGNGHLGCINHRHLRWATPVENQADKIEHGTTNRGQRCGTNKLTPSQVHEIRKLAAEKVPHKEIAMKFGIAASAVSAIHVRRIWFWLE